jgi:nuclear pore complex protein Nup107
MESQIENRWHKLRGFWEEEDRSFGTNDDDKDLLQGSLNEVFLALQGTQTPELLYVPFLFSSIRSLNSHRNASRNPYYLAQKMLILGRTDMLLNQFADQIVGLENNVSLEWVVYDRRKL